MSNLVKLVKLLSKHEGRKKFPYRCPKGYLTVGVGRNIETVGLSEDEIDLLLYNDIANRIKALSNRLAYWNEIDSVRQDVLIDMAFMGINSLMGFVNMFHAIEEKDWNKAAEEILNSDYAKDVGNRAIELARMMKTGAYDD